MKITRSESEWQAIFAQQAQSGLSNTAFCQQHKIAVTSFYKWRQKINAKPAKFVQAKVTSQTVQQIEVIQTPATILFESKAGRLTLPEQTTPAFFVSLIKGLSA